MLSHYLKLLLIILLLNSCAASSPHLAIPEKEPSTRHLKRLHPRVVLVLGSGSARGFAHAGVLKVLEEQHIPVDMIIGTSAGSIIGSLYADNPSASSLYRLLLKTPRHDVLDLSLMDLEPGIISGHQLQNFLLKNMRARSFEQLPIPFFAVATDVHTGKIHAFGSGPIAPAVNASSAVPPFFRPVTLYGNTYIDGGLIDPVAVDVARRYHPELIIAVSLNSPLSKSMPRTGPGVFLRGFDMMLNQLNDYSAAAAQIVIKPKLDEANMFDGTKRAELMRAGEMATYKALPAIKRLLLKYHISATQ